MGAFAALLYSDVISCDCFVLFAPQSRVNKQFWTTLGEKHSLWAGSLSDTVDFEFTHKSSKNMHMIFSRYHEDVVHIDRFASLGYDIEFVETENHTVAYTLALEGTLLEFVQSKILQ